MARQLVHLAVYHTMADWEHGFAVAGINNPRFQKEPGRYAVTTMAATREPVTSMGGVTIVPDLTLDQVGPEQSAMLILPGADLWDNGGNREFAAMARRFLDAGKPVAAICGATFGLANTGMLDDRDHTSGGVEYLQLSANYHGERHYQHSSAHSDGLLITASPAAPLEFAREIFATLELYAPEALESWYGFYRTGDAKHLYALMAG